MTDFSDIAGQVAALGAPILAALIGGPAGAAGGALASLAGALGVKAEPDALAAALASPAAVSVVQTVEVNELQARLADVQDARKQTVTLAAAGSGVAWTPSVLSAVVVAAFVGLTALLVFQTVPDSNIAMVLFGALASEFRGVMSYWFGSTRTSSAKTDQIGALIGAVSTPAKSVPLPRAKGA